MSDTKPQFLQIGNTAKKRKIAFLQQKEQNVSPGVIWLPGFHSTMENTKASELAKWCALQAVPMTRFDYSGHGRSSGKPEEGTISDWLEEAEAIVQNCTSGPQILVGSSMGAWITLLLIRNLSKNNAEKIHSAILIAPAWDMTNKLILPKLDKEARQSLQINGVYHTSSSYGDGPYIITRELIEDGDKHLIKDKPFAPNVPIRILHGMQDPDVPWQNSLELLEILQTDDAVLTLIKDGDHRLSRPSDIERMFREVSALLEH